MKCLNCSIINSENAQFCKNCGTELSFVATTTQNIDKPDKSINLLLIVMGTGLLMSLFYLIINKITSIDFGRIYMYLHIATSIISFTVTLIAAILIPNKKAKIFLFIFLFFELILFVAYL